MALPSAWASVKLLQEAAVACGACQHARVVVAAPKRRQHVAIDNHAAGRVSEFTFEAVPDLDTNLVHIGRDYHHRAGVGPLLPDPPMTSKLIAEVLDRKALQ